MLKPHCKLSVSKSLSEAMLAKCSENQLASAPPRNQMQALIKSKKESYLCLQYVALYRLFKS